MAIHRSNTSALALHRNLHIYKSTVLRLHSRSLWWWGTKSHRNNSFDEIEERLRRRQALMMHRYTKTFLRRNLWDREPAISSWRARAMKRDLLKRDLSASRAAYADVKDDSKTEYNAADPQKERQSAYEESVRESFGTWGREHHHDFESFKRAVDEAMQRDPYGTLFGRRLQGRNDEGRGWTSWSRIFDPREIKEDPKQEPEPVKEEIKQENRSRKPREEPGRLPGTQTSSQTAEVQPRGTGFEPEFGEEYIYDPIAGRKILKSNHTIHLDAPPTTTETSGQGVNSHSTSHAHPFVPSQPSSLSQPTANPDAFTPIKRDSPAPAPVSETKEPESKARRLISFLFNETGVNIPVKTFKEPSKETAKPKKASTESITSRKAEYNKLRASTLGNSIDTAFLFGGEFKAPPESEPVDGKYVNPMAEEPASQPYTFVAPKSPASSAKSATFPKDPNAAFSGTIYDGRAASQSTSDWLGKEGFRAVQGMSMDKSKVSPSLKASVLSSTKPSSVKLETALDRKASASQIPVKKFVEKLQPAMERVTPAALTSTTTSRLTVPASTTEAKPSKLELKLANEEKFEQALARDKKEDIDLLRASDVRAAAKAARITKQSIEDKKKANRLTLELDYSKSPQQDEAIGKPTKPTPGQSKSTTKTVAMNLSADTIAQHVKLFPDGIVARTIRNTKGAQHDIPKKAAGNTSIEALFRTQPMTAVPKFSEPTVAPGIERDLDIERHTQNFEPRLADIKDQAKSIKRDLHDIRLSVGDFINRKVIDTVASRDEQKQTSRLVAKLDAIRSKTSQLENAVERVQSRRVDSTEACYPFKSEVVEEIKPALPTIDYTSTYLLLGYNDATSQVDLQPRKHLIGMPRPPTSKLSPIAAIGSLKHSEAFTKHFAKLDSHDYELISGGNDMLIFKKKTSASSDGKVGHKRNLIFPDAAGPSPLLGKTNTEELRATIALAEMSAQPEVATIRPRKEAAAVLDHIPVPVPSPVPTTRNPTNRTPTSSPRSPATKPVSNSLPTSIPRKSSPPPIPMSSILTEPKPAPLNPTSPIFAAPSTSQLNEQRAKKGLPPVPVSKPASDHVVSETLRNKLFEPSAAQASSIAQINAGLPRDPNRKMVRQEEDGFTGRHGRARAISETASQSSQQNRNNDYDHDHFQKENPGFAHRASEFGKRVILTTVGLGVAAYAIGAVAEGVGASEQMASSEGGRGPMKRMVFEGKDR